MKVYAAVLAAGSGTRMGVDKVMLSLGGKAVWRWSYDVLSQHPEISGCILVCNSSNLTAPGVQAVAGGASRQASSRAALDALPSDAEALLVHDAARPFVSASVVSDVVEAIRRTGAAAAATPVTDTIKEISDQVRTLDRSKLIAMQTPQGARVDLLREAHARANAEMTDEMSLLEAMGVQPEIVTGDPQNFKITTPEDWRRALMMVGETRTGLGFDVHAFSSDPSRPLWLGGVRFEEAPGLEGHSDADVLLHAATDALLGAAGLGDIGQHFPNTDLRWKGEPSLTFLEHAAALLKVDGWHIVNLDISVIAEKPKIMTRALEIRTRIAEALGVEVNRVSVKATTNEGLGSIGRGEGIAAFATAAIKR